MTRPAGSCFGKEGVGQGSFVTVSVGGLSHEEPQVSRGEEQHVVPMSSVWATAAQAGGTLMESVLQQLPAIHYQLLIADLEIPHGMVL